MSSMRVVRNPISKELEFIISAGNPHAVKAMEYLISLHDRSSPEELEAVQKFEFQLFAHDNLAGRLSGRKIDPIRSEPRMLTKDELFRLNEEQLDAHFKEIQHWLHPYREVIKGATESEQVSTTRKP